MNGEQENTTQPTLGETIAAKGGELKAEAVKDYQAVEAKVEKFVADVKKKSAPTRKKVQAKAKKVQARAKKVAKKAAKKAGKKK